MEITALSSCTYNTCPISSSPYGYRPSQGVNIVFILSFASSFTGLLIITLYTQKWLTLSIPLCIACLFEVIGYAVRIGSWHNPWDMDLYAVTEFFLTVAPSLVSGSIYLVTQRMLFYLGQEHSILNPTWYQHFILADIASFAVQVVGLGIAMWDIVATSNVGPKSDRGGFIIAVGIGIHALMMAIFLVIYIIALVSAGLAVWEQGYTTFNPDRGGYKRLSLRFKIFLAALLNSALCLLARDTYRTIGFVDGFDGGNRVEGWFALFDSLMVSQAVLGLVLLHPSYVFTDFNREKEVDNMSTSTPISYGKLARQVII